MLAVGTNAGDVAQTAGQLLRSRLEIASLDIANEAAVGRMRLSLPITMAPDVRIVFVGLIGDRAAMARQEEEVRGLAGGTCARLDEMPGQVVWEALREVPHPQAEDSVVVRASLPISHAAEALDFVSQSEGWWAAARAGAGTVYAGPPPGPPSPATLERLTEFRSFAEQRDGYMFLEAGAPEMKRSFGIWGTMPNLELFRKLKDAFDPTGNLGCWRYLPRS
jgi:hypothetical protein